MPASKPEEIHELFTKFFNAGDLDALLALYEPDAVITPPGQIVKGLTGIREVLGTFLSLKGKFNLQPEKVLHADGVALLISKWTLTSSAAELAGTTSDVVRRQADGSWLIAIDNPYGTA